MFQFIVLMHTNNRKNADLLPLDSCSMFDDDVIPTIVEDRCRIPTRHQAEQLPCHQDAMLQEKRQPR